MLCSYSFLSGPCIYWCCSVTLIKLVPLVMVLNVLAKHFIFVLQSFKPLNLKWSIPSQCHYLKFHCKYAVWELSFFMCLSLPSLQWFRRGAACSFDYSQISVRVHVRMYCHNLPVPWSKQVDLWSHTHSHTTHKHSTERLLHARVKLVHGLFKWHKRFKLETRLWSRTICRDIL